VLTGYTTDGKPIQRNKTVKGNRREAQTALAKFVTEAEAGTVAASGATTFGRYLTEQYLPQVKDMIVSSALTQACKWGMVPRSVAPLATLPSIELREPTLPTLEQIAELVGMTRGSDSVLSAAIMLAALTGCRRGELCGLKWGDVDRARMVRHVRRAAKRADGGEKLIGPTKTHATRRSIDDVTLSVLDEHLARATDWAKAADVPIGEDGFVLTWDQSGTTPANPDVVTTKFARLTDKAGIPQVGFHDLRHVVATTLLAEGTDVATVAMRLGHASPVTTMRVYAHVLEAHDRKAAGVMGALLASTKAE
jgi:integrase